jgi:lipopolysaccharide/colanic/teichoic acid biosynthesis glycosyltransferase
VKRVFDVTVSAFALLLLSPLLVLVAVWVKLDSAGAVIFRQERIGRNGIPFSILKFRTMIESKDAHGPQITAATDDRITRSGQWLRKSKVDELPQLINVLFGQMSIVGPRPEVRKYVDLYPELARAKILSVRPGITDNAAIIFRDEAVLLARAADPEHEYIENILPAKISVYEKYVDSHSLAGDVGIIIRTMLRLFRDP